MTLSLTRGDMTRPQRGTLAQLVTDCWLQPEYILYAIRHPDSICSSATQQSSAVTKDTQIDLWFFATRHLPWGAA